MSLLCSEPQSTVLWSALCKRSDDYLKMPLNLKTSLSCLLNSIPGLFLGQHHSTGSTSLTQCFSTPGRRKASAPSVPTQALPSIGWLNHSIPQNRKVILSSALHMHNEHTFSLSENWMHSPQCKQQGWGLFISTVMLHNWSKYRTGIRYNHTDL